MSTIDYNRIVYFKKVENVGPFDAIIDSFYAIEEPDGNVRKNIDYNEFDSPIQPPKNYIKSSVTTEMAEEFDICGTKPILYENNSPYQLIKEKTSGFRKYFVHFNYQRPFLVYVGPEKVFVYKVPEDMYAGKEDGHSWAYIQLVKEYNPEKVWVGKSPLNDSTEFSGGHGSDFDGNTILLYLGNDRYVFIGHEFYEFTMPTGDSLVDYYSPVGNNDVPYPVLWGNNNVYFMAEQVYAPISEFNCITDERERSDAYFYGHKEGVKSDIYNSFPNIIFL